MTRVLVVNAGSSSVKLSLVDGDRTVWSESVDPADAGDAVERRAAEGGAEWGGAEGGGIDAVGHRIVHGGTRFTGPALVDDAVLDAIAALADLAPLHQGPAVDALRRTRAALPGVAQVACFDTAFHRSLPAAAHTYAVPDRWRHGLGVRRYGFHGLAHEWSARRAAEIVGRPVGELRTVTAHLGSGASLCAVDRGRSVDTTMGFTPTAGLVMGTRCGDLDPSVPPYLQRRGVPADEVGRALDRESGLLALAGSSDVRDVVGLAATGDDDALIALDVWAHRARALVAAMTAALGGIDVLAFSGGVGEHQPVLRARVVDGLGFLGLALDPAANEAAGGDADVTAPGAPARAVVVTAREDLVVAEQVRALVPAART
ncbi:acetate/propionate family kinase [Pseudonocardia sp. KRD-184]|uniref:Acetate kinase n=1 Tax=Pseudonocardia oceani TaxID=2792013 RepID=A0ABS6UHY1_9PSEU|nr:acetate/propionate family kinase [Pseudonocardia oceani]MBW0092053.1 acetate/propionate family kinase [Pseudonocardia oceani]MBW0099107.1 acetate/propionate family kinase [Pseudonocardia oceani]MBW0112090.1 acetate/propionate family kinase [Pseudonocardia oceani]MBW0123075.1 acetate/propionate family kinase [Pseudonocardia oceani]MBW0131838.1 acetate/propionate family kinase [Pseudonocardia oceani]